MYLLFVAILGWTGRQWRCYRSTLLYGCDCTNTSDNYSRLAFQIIALPIPEMNWHDSIRWLSTFKQQKDILHLLYSIQYGCDIKSCTYKNKSISLMTYRYNVKGPQLILNDCKSYHNICKVSIYILTIFFVSVKYFYFW